VIAGLALTTDVAGDESKALALARELALPFVAARDRAGVDLLLVQTADRLELREAITARSRPIYVDFAGGPTSIRRLTGQSRRQPIARAIGIAGRSPSVVDATGGLARDAFLLASLGCEVTAVERSPVLFALVRDGLHRAAGEFPALDRVLARLAWRLGDSRDVLREMRDAGAAPQVVYLDPMYAPARRSALAKKEMRICRRLVGDDEDAGELLEVALATARRRVVVKRHPEAPPLAPRPTHRVQGRTVRYDVYLLSAATGSGRATSKSSSSAAS